MRVEEKSKEIPSAKDFVPPQPIYKLMAIFGMVIVATALFWLAWNNALHNVDFSLSVTNVLTIISTLLAFALMFAVVALAEVLITKRFYLLLVVIIASFTGFIFFSFSIWTMIAVLIMALSWLYWRRDINNDMKTRTAFKPQQVLDSGLKGAVTLILLAVSVMYYGFLIAQPNTETNIVDGLVDTSMGAVNFGLEKFYGDSYSRDMTLDAFIANITRISDLRERGAEEIEAITPEIEELDQQIKAGLVAAEDELIIQGRQQFLETFDIIAEGSDTMDIVVRTIVTKNISDVVEPYQRFIPALLALSIFFVLNIFSIVYREFIKLFSLLLYHILKWIHFINITKVQTEVERVTL